MRRSRSRRGRARTSGERARRARGGRGRRIFALELAPGAEVTSGTTSGCLGGDTSKAVLNTVAARELQRKIHKQVRSIATKQTHLVGDLRRGGSGWQRGPNSESLGGFLEPGNINYEGRARAE